MQGKVCVCWDNADVPSDNGGSSRIMYVCPKIMQVYRRAMYGIVVQYRVM
jgi:hypothetical protein